MALYGTLILNPKPAPASPASAAAAGQGLGGKPPRANAPASAAAEASANPAASGDPAPSAAARQNAAGPSIDVQPSSPAGPGGGTAGTLQGKFDLVSMATQGTSLDMLDKVVTENQVLLTYEKGSAPRKPATVSGTFILTVTLDDELLFAIHSAVGRGALGASPPPMPAAWRGCTATSELRGRPRRRPERTREDEPQGDRVGHDPRLGPRLRADPGQHHGPAQRDLTRVPWTSTGGETGLGGRSASPDRPRSHRKPRGRSLHTPRRSGRARSTWAALAHGVTAARQDIAPD